MEQTEMKTNAAAVKEQSRKALSKCNEVTGFDPNTLLSRFGNEESGFYNYLKAAPRLAWFRLAHPNGGIVFVNHEVTAGHSFVEAQVFLNKEDQHFTANGFAWVDKDDTLAGQNHLKSAQTNAMCIALGHAGFGTPVHARYDQEINIYSQTEDIGEVPLDLGTAEPIGTKPITKEKPKRPRKNAAKGNLDDLAPLSPEGAAGTVATVSEDNQIQNDKAAQPEVQAQPPANETIPAAGQEKPAAEVEADEEPAQQSGQPGFATLEDAMTVVIPTGNYKGKTFAQVAEEVSNFKRVIDFYANPIGDTVPETIRKTAEFIHIHKFGGE